MNENQIAYIYIYIYIYIHIYHIYAGAQPEIVQGRGGFLKLGHFNKHFLKKPKIKSPAAENFGAFCPRYS